MTSKNIIPRKNNIISLFIPSVQGIKREQHPNRCIIVDLIMIRMTSHNYNENKKKTQNKKKATITYWGKKIYKSFSNKIHFISYDSTNIFSYWYFSGLNLSLLISSFESSYIKIILLLVELFHR